MNDAFLEHLVEGLQLLAVFEFLAEDGVLLLEGVNPVGKSREFLKAGSAHAVHLYLHPERLETAHELMAELPKPRKLFFVVASLSRRNRKRTRFHRRPRFDFVSQAHRQASVLLEDVRRTDRLADGAQALQIAVVVLQTELSELDVVIVSFGADIIVNSQRDIHHQALQLLWSNGRAVSGAART